MPKRKRTPLERERFLHDVSMLYMRDYTQAAIAELLHCTPAEIGDAIKSNQKRWTKKLGIGLSESQAAELARVDELERNYWQAWEESRKPREVSTTERTRDAKAKEDEGKLKATLRKETRAGGTEYLRGVERCIQARARILRLHAAAKSDPEAPTVEGATEARQHDDNPILTLAERVDGVLTLFDFIAAHAARKPAEPAEDAVHDAGADPETGGVPPAG